jgi:hypothetical protein
MQALITATLPSPCAAVFNNAVLEVYAMNPDTSRYTAVYSVSAAKE